MKLGLLLLLLLPIVYSQSARQGEKEQIPEGALGVDGEMVGRWEGCFTAKSSKGQQFLQEVKGKITLEECVSECKSYRFAAIQIESRAKNWNSCKCSCGDKLQRLGVYSENNERDCLGSSPGRNRVYELTKATDHLKKKYGKNVIQQ
eukprot:UN33481